MGPSQKGNPHRTLWYYYYLWLNITQNIIFDMSSDTLCAFARFLTLFVILYHSIWSIYKYWPIRIWIGIIYVIPLDVASNITALNKKFLQQMNFLNSFKRWRRPACSLHKSRKWGKNLHQILKNQNIQGDLFHCPPPRLKVLQYRYSNPIKYETKGCVMTTRGRLRS